MNDIQFEELLQYVDKICETLKSIEKNLRR